jgi:RNA polymerase sigma-70 factor (ECF subfamily)
LDISGDEKRKEAEFLELIKKHQSIIHKTCFIFCRNNSDKDDLYQEITLQLWKSFSSFKGQAAFSTWMYRVALNTAITMAKKPDLILASDEVSAIPYEMENTVDYSEDVKILYKAIARLSRVEKGIILLWLEEKSYEEIAEAVGISVKNVSVKLVRIKAKLGEIINKIQ